MSPDQNHCPGVTTRSFSDKITGAICESTCFYVQLHCNRSASQGLDKYRARCTVKLDTRNGRHFLDPPAPLLDGAGHTVRALIVNNNGTRTGGGGILHLAPNRAGASLNKGNRAG